MVATAGRAGLGASAVGRLRGGPDYARGRAARPRPARPRGGRTIRGHHETTKRRAALKEQGPFAAPLERAIAVRHGRPSADGAVSGGRADLVGCAAWLFP